jgi:hypothetical protein
VFSGTAGLGPDGSRFPYRRAKNCLGDDGLEILVTDEGLFTVLLVLFVLSAASSIPGVGANTTEGLLSAMDCNISQLFYRLISLQFNFRYIVFNH